jgi:uncharacterized protein (DUF1778 family)
MKNMGKTTTINLKVTPEFKALLIQQAAAQHRSMTTYIEWLVMQDAPTTGTHARTEPKNRRG